MTEPQSSPLGGFLPPTPTSLPSPAPLASAPSDFLTPLPRPRNRALRPNSNKEDMVRNYASAKLMHVARRYVKKLGDAAPGGEVEGYTRFAELCADLDAVVNVLWLSGTPSLQIQILLRIASEFTEYAPAFAPDPPATLRLLRKLDHCFASLATGRDLATRDSLPGFEGPAAGMTTTDLVRCRSTVENSRALMFSLLGEGDASTVEEEVEEEEDESGTDGYGGETPVSAVSTPRPAVSSNTDVDRIYENTILAIGERFGGVI